MPTMDVRRKAFRLWFVPAGAAGIAAVMILGCATPFPKDRSDVISNLHDADYGSQGQVLSMAALKGFQGDIHYVGSDDRFDYFRVERKRGFFRMELRGDTIGGHKRFRVGSQKPFRVGWGAIPYPMPFPTDGEL